MGYTNAKDSFTNWHPSQKKSGKHLSASRPGEGRADELPTETVRMRRQSVAMAFYEVSHFLANRVPGLKAAQEATTVVRDRRFSQNPDHF